VPDHDPLPVVAPVPDAMTVAPLPVAPVLATPLPVATPVPDALIVYEPKSFEFYMALYTKCQEKKIYWTMEAEKTKESLNFFE
jgi:hypothetical protein